MDATQKILVVTEDAALLQLLEMMLSAHSYSVLSSDTESAPEVLISNSDIVGIVVDIVIPYEWALLFAELVVLQEQSPRVVVLTSLSEPSLLKQLGEYEITSVIAKPAKFNDIIDALGI